MPCLKKIISENEVEIQNKLEKIKVSVKLCTAVLVALELGRFLACKLLEMELLERSKVKCAYQNLQYRSKNWLIQSKHSELLRRRQ
ncbi:hypothetical protein [Candidatus Uabimicrobium sp. HlEnr_7]|uniref:hypothetical protein n=1 Tax=Candidatus Uabimicrobium helgolandensis TaxID=3095367 RepID=UPI003556427E